MQFLIETVSQPQDSTTLPCNPPRWTTFNYYDESDPKEDTGGATFARDMTVGEFVERTIASEDVPCNVCKKTGMEHYTYWMHSKERISVSLAKVTPADDSTIDTNNLRSPPRSIEPRIFCWTTCKTCQLFETTPRALMSPGTYLFSFSKFCELILYDSNFYPSEVSSASLLFIGLPN